MSLISCFARRATFVLLAMSLSQAPALAATPDHGTLSDTSGPITYTAGPFNTPNPTPEPSGQLDSGPECANPGQTCDSYALTVALPADYTTRFPNAHIQVTLSWTDAGSGKSDYDLYVYKGAAVVPTGQQQAYSQSATSKNPEVDSFFATSGTRQYTVLVVPFTPTGEMVNVKIEFLPGPEGATGNPHLAEADAAVPGVPRYQNFYPPKGSAGEATSGEFNIGFDPKTSRIMVMNRGPILRLTPPEKLSPVSPQSCEAFWEDVSAASTNTGVDPILWTDQTTGRTFASNSTAGANALFAYTDNDGDMWTPFSVSPPDGGADHETIGSGPYPAASPLAGNPVYPNAVYYCSQTGQGTAAFCQRSDTGGVSFGPGIKIYDGVTTKCNGLHGHVRVAPDGAAYVPVMTCGANQGGAVSTDAGLTWTEFLVPASAPQGTDASDPSVGIATDSTAYFCYVNADGHPHVSVSHDDGKTWVDDHDIGVSKGINNAVFPQAWAGDPNRAACGFLGTDRAGNSKGLDFPGLWYAFISTTYDGGKTWVTVNASPNDPAQGAGGIWNAGGSNQNRNQLDFNEVTADDKGNVLYGYDDGCVGDCVNDPTNNSFVAFMRVARQTGGKTLFAANDPVEPAPPKAACLAGTRDQFASHLLWKAPDHGGADIVEYKIYRGTSASSIGATPVGDIRAGTAYQDSTADPAVKDYFYRIVAINSAGAGVASNLVDLTVTPLVIEYPCKLPGLTEATSPTGNASPNMAAWDLQTLHLAEPTDQAGKLVFTVKVADLSSVPPATRWSVRFTTANKPANGDDDYFVMMTTESGATPAFVYGTTGSAMGAPVRVFNQAGSLDAGSQFSPDGTIVLVLDKSKIADLTVPGNKVQGLLTQTRAIVTPQNEAIYDSMGGDATYVLLQPGSCGAVTPPGLPPPPVTTASSGERSRFGGGLGLLLLLPLLGTALSRRR